MMTIRTYSRGILARARGVALAAATISAGCVSTTPPEGAHDPSSANAHTAPMPCSSPVLNEDHSPLPEAASGAHDHGSPSTGAHDHSSHATQPAAPGNAGHDHEKHDQSSEQTVMYICPMHPEVRQSEPGRCPKCGMALELEQPKSGTQ